MKSNQQPSSPQQSGAYPTRVRSLLGFMDSDTVSKPANVPQPLFFTKEGEQTSLISPDAYGTNTREESTGAEMAGEESKTIVDFPINDGERDVITAPLSSPEAGLKPSATQQPFDKPESSMEPAFNSGDLLSKFAGGHTKAAVEPKQDSSSILNLTTTKQSMDRLADKPELKRAQMETEAVVSETVERKVDEVSLSVLGVSNEKRSFPMLVQNDQIPGKENRLENKSDSKPVHPVGPVLKVNKVQKDQEEPVLAIYRQMETATESRLLQKGASSTIAAHESPQVIQTTRTISPREIPEAHIPPSDTSWRNPVTQLQKGLNQLETQVANHASKLDQADKSQDPARPVVILNRAIQAPRTPHAYWARSYLGRFHLKNRR